MFVHRAVVPAEYGICSWRHYRRFTYQYANSNWRSSSFVQIYCVIQILLGALFVFCCWVRSTSFGCILSRIVNVTGLNEICNFTIDSVFSRLTPLLTRSRHFLSSSHYSNWWKLFNIPESNYYAVTKWKKKSNLGSIA